MSWKRNIQKRKVWSSPLGKNYTWFTFRNGVCIYIYTHTNQDTIFTRNSWDAINHTPWDSWNNKFLLQLKCYHHLHFSYVPGCISVMDHFQYVSSHMSHSLFAANQIIPTFASHLLLCARTARTQAFMVPAVTCLMLGHLAGNSKWSQ